jgi:hypothetical protein
MTLRNGEPSEDDLSFLSERMRDCPIYRNLSGAKKTTTIEVSQD